MLRQAQHDVLSAYCPHSLVGFLADVFGVPKRDVLLLSGHTAPFKKVEISGLSDETGAAVLARYRASGS